MARLPAECATIGQVLQDNGDSAFWVGMNHNVPEEDVSSGGSKSEWPLQKGFDRECTDAQVGRIVDYLKQTDQFDNTIIFYAADNGASGEGSPNGSVNENIFFNGYPDELSENLQYLETLGTADTYNHYPTGWAVAFSTPFQMFKRYSQYSGGTCDPLVIHWPKGSRPKAKCAISTTTSPTSCRRSSTSWGWRCRRPIGVSSSIR